MLSSTSVLTGFEAGATMAEETINASEAAPKGMVKTILISTVGGFIMNVSFLFACRNDIDTVLNGPTTSPIVNIFSLVFTSVSDDGTSGTAQTYAVLLTILLVLNTFLNGFV